MQHDSTAASAPSPPHSSHRAGWWIAAAVLVAYGILSWLRHSPDLIWDEGRYLTYAQNLTQGFYVPQGDPTFVNGPGYPIVLMPFCGMDEGLRWARLLNAFLMAGAVVFVWLTLRHYAGAKWAAFAAVVTGFHPTLLWMGFAIMTEPLALFCICGFAWSYCHALRSPKNNVGKWILLAILLLAWLILTRVIFGHVIMATGLLTVLLLLPPVFREWRPALFRTLLILAGAFLLCVPYLLHTWQKTGQVLGWSTNSGELLYWITSTHPGENGHWFSPQNAQDPQAEPEVAAKHASIYRRLMSLPILDREVEFKRLAMEHLKADPAGVAYNWICNLTRLVFGFPRSHQEEELRTIVLIGVNGAILALFALAAAVATRFWRSLPPEVWLLQAFTAIYLGGSSLAPSLPRYFVLVLPLLLLGTACVFHRHLRLIVLKPNPVEQGRR